MNTIEDKQLVQVTKIHKPFRSWAYMGIAGSTCRMCSVKGRSKRTNASVEVSTNNRQQLRLDALQCELQLSGRVSFSDAPFC